MRRKLLPPILGTLILLGGLAIPARAAGADELANAKARANKAAAELGKAESALGRLDKEIANLTARQADAQQRLDQLRTAAREVVIRRFINADATQVAELDPDINNQARADALSRYATQGNQDAIDGYTAADEDLKVARAGLDRKLASQKSAVAALDRKRAELNKELKRLEVIDAQKRKAALAKQASQSSQAGAASSRKAPTGPIATGSFVCPVQGAVAFSDTWGAPRSGGRSHQGVDMLAARGTPTVAPVSGSVKHRGNSTGGLSWHLYGDDGNYYYGTHLSAYANEGAGHVQGGTVIGYVGDTGNAKGTPHLHFEIHPNGGRAVNPTPTVRKAC